MIQYLTQIKFENIFLTFVNFKLTPKLYFSIRSSYDQGSMVKILKICIWGYDRRSDSLMIIYTQLGSEILYRWRQRSVDMDTNLMDTGVHVHVTDMDVDMDTRFLKIVTWTWTWTRVDTGVHRPLGGAAWPCLHGYFCKQIGAMLVPEMQIR